MLGNTTECANFVDSCIALTDMAQVLAVGKSETTFVENVGIKVSMPG